MNKYDDIIDMSRPASLKHKPMPISERAKIFAPFAALRGHEEAIDGASEIQIMPELEHSLDVEGMQTIITDIF